MTANPGGILMAHSALDKAVADGTAALPQETGGILLGFRTPGLIVVTRTLTVPDPRSSRHGYLRRHRRAQTRMALGRGDAPLVVGYVGEWHTHPADVGPSLADRRALAAVARLAQGPVALVVLADPPAGPAHVHGVVAARRALWPVAAINPVEVADARVVITDDTTASLEAEAASLTQAESS
ncbi:Mov34/MPN/PAD-1 family protein [Micromonospora palomenae]|uniref:Mov34/MPN/PAD-1 family protein n=1 Tax=Micromonospora palomenae TaxID=1461247 RepID=UPI003F8C6DB4